ncbi:hypothetical protein [Aeromonas veronii]|uniref:hypothetical protein n=1 Tax=Aeromonas veronii TaxID=654 RepID=UPI003F74A04F
MTIKHTPEPWQVHQDASGDVFISSAETSFHIAEIGSEDDEAVIPDARRIVACVNACRGLPTDELEQKGLVAAVGTQLLEADQQRDELLTALEALAECYCEAGNELSKSERAHHRAVYRDALSAIEKAKAKGGAA